MNMILSDVEETISVIDYDQAGVPSIKVSSYLLPVSISSSRITDCSAELRDVICESRSGSRICGSIAYELLRFEETECMPLLFHIEYW